MAKHVVTKAFTDLQDLMPDGKGYVYRKNDFYPRKGRATKTRLAELLGDDNLRKESVIEIYAESTEPEVIEEAIPSAIVTVEDTEVKVADK